MLASLLAICLAQTPSDEARAKRVFDLLASNGFKVEAREDKWAVLTYRGEKARAMVYSVSDGSFGFETVRAYLSPSLVNRSKLKAWMDEHAVSNPLTWTRLDGFTELTLDSPLGKNPTDASVLKGAQRHWQLAVDLKRSVLPAKTKPIEDLSFEGPLLVSDSYHPETLIPEDAMLLLREWEFKISFGGYGRNWQFLVDVKGTTLHLSGGAAAPFINLEYEVKPLYRRAGEKIEVPWATVSDSGIDKLLFLTTVDYSKPKSLKTIREEIERFAGNCADWTAHNRPPPSKLGSERPEA